MEYILYFANMFPALYKKNNTQMRFFVGQCLIQSRRSSTYLDFAICHVLTQQSCRPHLGMYKRRVMDRVSHPS